MEDNENDIHLVQRTLAKAGVPTRDEYTRSIGVRAKLIGWQGFGAGLHPRDYGIGLFGFQVTRWSGMGVAKKDLGLAVMAHGQSVFI